MPKLVLDDGQEIELEYPQLRGSLEWQVRDWQKMIMHQEPEAFLLVVKRKEPPPGEAAPSEAHKG